ncbi:MAG: FAD binding domain-containing protein [Chloroflexota bacterium]
MKPAAFEYRRPESLDEALELLAEHGDEAKPLAGGQSLVPLLAMRLAQPALLVDLDRVPGLKGIDGGRMGAMVTQARLEREADLPGVVKAALPHIGHFQVRTRGTVGGSLCHADPAAEWPALALLLGAVLHVRSRRGERRLAAAEFTVGPLMTALEPDELLVAVELAAAAGGFGFAEVERRGGDFALVGAAAQGGAVVVFATGATPQRLGAVEAHLAAGGGPGPELRKLAEAEIQATGDIHASAGYRRRVGAALADRVVAAARA